LNNNGQLHLISTPDQTYPPQASEDIPQTLIDYAAVKSELDFTGIGKIQDLNVTLDIQHEYDADLDVYLISPTGTRVKLFADVGTSGDDFHLTNLDDEALISIDDGAAPFTGTFRPQEPLSTFIDEDAFGTWTLEITDDAAGDHGTLLGWSLTFKLQGVTNYLEPFQVTDSGGNYTFTSLPPGVYNVREYVTPDQILEGWKPTWAPAPVTVRSGANVLNVDFGNWIPVALRGSIQGEKFYDANQDGVKGDGEPGLSGWVVYVDSNGNGVRDIASLPTVLPATDLPKPITDFQTTTSQVNVASLGTVFKVEVTLSLTHSFVDDLDAYLISPSGRQVELFTAVGGQYNDFTNLILTDDADRSISTIGFDDLPYTGPYRPEGLLSDFIGDDSAGIWTLVVSDTAFADQGFLDSWSLSITSGELFRTTDQDGKYQFDNLVPGDYVVREEEQSGWVQIPPADIDIPGALWNGSSSRWEVTVVGVDDFTDPDGPDSKRNVKNVDFGNYAPTGSIEGYVYRDLDGNFTRFSSEPGLSDWTVFIDSDGNGLLDTGTVDEELTSNTAQAINNFFVTTSTLSIGSMTTISDIDVSLDIGHTYDADLTAYLISPSGTRVKLFSGVGGSGDNFTNTTFDDSALLSIDAGAAPFDDVFRPAELLSAFNGENAKGVWTLEITDSSAADDGTLNSWSLAVKGDELSTLTDADGHYSFPDLAPGNYRIATVLMPNWTPTEVPGVVTLAPSQQVTDVNFGFRPPFLAGDFNSDGFVDSADFVVWRRQTGASVPNFSGADGDGDGDVDQDDYNVWRANFGRFGRYYDDHGNNAAAATDVSLPGTRGGNIEVAGDLDWFQFSAVAGSDLQLQATVGTLDAAELVLFDVDGLQPPAEHRRSSITRCFPMESISFKCAD
jgi:subtilisin-like proprotein convertase family protein